MRPTVLCFDKSPPYNCKEEHSGSDFSTKVSDRFRFYYSKDMKQEKSELIGYPEGASGNPGLSDERGRDSGKIDTLFTFRNCGNYCIITRTALPRMDLLEV
jgi:hypothetical protein